MIAAVTGAAGHAGANLIRALEGAGHAPRMLVRSDRRAVKGVRGEVLSADLFDTAALRRAFDGADVVFHLAAQVSVDGDPDGRVHATNVRGTQHVVDAAAAAGVRRLVHFSTVHALDPRPHHAPLDESRPYVEGGSAYDASKVASERIAQSGRARGLEVVCINPTGVIGPHDHKPSRMGQLIWGLYRGTVPAVVAGGFDFVDARDLAETSLRAATDGRDGDRYIVGGRYRTLLQLAEVVRAVSGRRRVTQIELPLWVARAVAEPSARVLRRLGRTPSFTDEALDVLEHGHPRVCSDKARKELGHAPRPLEDTVRDTIAWFESARPRGVARPGRVSARPA